MRSIWEKVSQSMGKQLAVDIGGGITLKNPVMTASGTFGYAREFHEFIDLARLGGIIVKGLSLKPSKGNPPPRIVETPGGMLNAIGLENIGIDAFISEKLPFLKQFATPVFANIYGRDIQEYAALAARFDQTDDVTGVEVNISCPNVTRGGIAFGADPEIAHQVVRAVRNRTGKHVMVKLSPNVTDIADIAGHVADAGADSISLINTLTGMAVDVDTARPRLANITGGLSGPAIKPIALRMVWQVAQKVGIPVIGIGGIMTTQDALEFLMVGATAIQVGTANFVNPRTSMEIVAGLTHFLEKKKLNGIKDIIGSLNTNSKERTE
jgi:dihydroorotate dehydrogenase (NAD+) catalytic subunit